VLLDEDGCSVYSSRPLPCRGYYSLSEPACSQRLNLGGADPANLAAARVVEFAALEISGSDRQPPFEVNTLLHRIYADPAKAARWAAGDATDESDSRQQPWHEVSACSRASASAASAKMELSPI